MTRRWLAGLLAVCLLSLATGFLLHRALGEQRELLAAEQARVGFALQRQGEEEAQIPFLAEQLRTARALQSRLVPLDDARGELFRLVERADMAGSTVTEIVLDPQDPHHGLSRRTFQLRGDAADAHGLVRLLREIEAFPHPLTVESLTFAGSPQGRPTFSLTVHLYHR